MAKKLLGFSFLIILISCCYSNIHRTISGSGNSIKSRLKLPTTGLIDESDEEVETTGLFDRVLEKANTAWLYAIPAAILVGSTGIFPLLIFNAGNCPSGHKLNEAISPAHLRLLLSFSVGGLFGDVFLHLLPEAFMYLDPNDHFAAQRLGMWMIAGLLCFFVIERIFSIHEELNEQEKEKKEDGEPEIKADVMKNGKVHNGLNEYKNGHINGYLNGKVNGKVNGYTNGLVPHCDENGHANGIIKRKKPITDNGTSTNTDNACVTDEHEQDHEKKIVGYLNLLANCIDNFTHGLAVGGSFIVSAPVGACTTLAILLHEIPHEIGDFAILLKAGFNRWEAAKGQIITASGALIGCLFGLLAEGAGDASAWVLPFTSGGFIYIACVTVIPDLLKEESLRESIKQMLALFAGISIMGLVGLCH